MVLIGEASRDGLTWCGLANVLSVIASNSMLFSNPRSRSPGPDAKIDCWKICTFAVSRINVKS
jgi:hypothetical protein